MFDDDFGVNPTVVEKELDSFDFPEDIKKVEINQLTGLIKNGANRAIDSILESKNIPSLFVLGVSVQKDVDSREDVGRIVLSTGFSD